MPCHIISTNHSLANLCTDSQGFRRHIPEKPSLQGGATLKQVVSEKKARCGLLLVFCKLSFTICKTKVDLCFDFSFRRRNSEP